MFAEGHKLRLVVQPIVDVTAPGRISGEVLLRGGNSLGQSFSPQRLVAQAESRGTIAQLDSWVVSSALSWLEQNLPALLDLNFISLNVSAATINDAKSFGKILACLEGHSSMVRNKVCIEMTETVAVADHWHAQRAIVDLQLLGARVAIDDFGAGHANASLLRDLTVDAVKIDGSLIRHVLTDTRARAIVEATAAMVHALGSQCVAEQVEDRASVPCLRAMGIRFFQGFSLARPMELDDFSGCVARRQAWLVEANV